MTTWTVQLNTLESRAAEHERFSNQLLSSLAEPLKNLAAQTEDLRKHHADYASKLEAERDGSYADLKKTKSKYDSVCEDVEKRRKKIEGSYDSGKTKAQAAFQQQQSDMRNMKVGQIIMSAIGCSSRWQNTYLITINVTNKQKERYYHEYVPDLLDVRLQFVWKDDMTLPGHRLAKHVHTVAPGPFRDAGIETQLHLVIGRDNRDADPDPLHGPLEPSLWRDSTQ